MRIISQDELDAVNGAGVLDVVAGALIGAVTEGMVGLIAGGVPGLIIGSTHGAMDGIAAALVMEGGNGLVETLHDHDKMSKRLRD